MVVVLRRGQVVAVGSHEELLHTSDLYRRIFSHYDSARTDAVTAAVE
jgi:ATP-binding cassette subfamily B protein